jgi:hypothetical protein
MSCASSTCIDCLTATWVRSTLQHVRLRLPLGPWVSVQASSELVATHDNRRVLVWPAAGPGAAPLALHHTKAFQVWPIGFPSNKHQPQRH